jgi:hypothetical protein
VISVRTATPSGMSIFCDDIRQEINGKVSLIGVYAGDLILFGTLPGILPRLSIRTVYFERPGESSDPIELLVYLPGDPDDKPSMRGMMAFKRPTPEEEKKLIEEYEVYSSDPLITLISHTEIVPLVLTQEGLIRVRARRGDLEIKLGSLRVRCPQPPAPPMEAIPEPPLA